MPMSPNTGIPTDPAQFAKPGNKAETLDKALSRVWQTEWQHLRSGKTLKSQAEIAIRAVAGIMDGLEPWQWQKGYATQFRTPEEVDISAIHRATAEWYKQGLSPATITKRLNCLSKLGVAVEGSRVKVPKQLKWHLPLSMVQDVAHWIEEEADRRVVPYDLARFVRWTCHTGLRLEETLRLRTEDFKSNFKEVSVPGLKTATSQAVLPLGSYPRMLASSQCMDIISRPFIESTYEELQVGWDAVRARFGWKDDPTATLKALRRSAARYLHVDCGMPLHMVQQYLRHESMDTTLEYLRLTGGYGTEEMRRYLK